MQSIQVSAGLLVRTLLVSLAARFCGSVVGAAAAGVEERSASDAGFWDCTLEIGGELTELVGVEGDAVGKCEGLAEGFGLGGLRVAVFGGVEGAAVGVVVLVVAGVLGWDLLPPSGSEWRAAPLSAVALRAASCSLALELFCAS